MATLRDATAADAAALAVLAERTFRETFAASNTRANLDAFCAGAYGETIQGHEIADPQRETLLAEMDGALVGFGQLRWGQPPDCVRAARPAEVQRLYVDAPWHGRGVAQALMAELLARAERGGADQVWLGVWEHNPRAIAFYRKHGFAPVGDHLFVVGEDPQRDVVMVRPVGRVAPAIAGRGR
jgi:ribosomal protein S18 acetylase RimI-like enzyme